MKRKPYLTILNTAAVELINAAVGSFERLALGDGERTFRYRLVKYGIHPQVMVVNGEEQTIFQVVDDEAADALISNFRTVGAGVPAMFKGVPVYEGHADDAGWRAAHPGHKASAVARIKDLKKEADGVWAEAVANSSGVELLGGEAPAYTGHSPRWRCVPVAGRPKHYRPVVLWSDALTNEPNIPGSVIALNDTSYLADAGDNESPEPEKAQPENQENDDTMKLTAEAMKALGFAPDAMPTPEEISAAIVKMLGEKTTAEADLVTANSRVTTLESARNQARDLIIANAVTSGRITEADKPRWIDALNADFAGESAKLEKLMPVLNTANHLGQLGGRRGATPDVSGGIDAMNAAVRAYATEKNIDISTGAGWAKAWDGAVKEKPEVFKRG